MSRETQNSLSRRERQIMDIVYRKGKVSAMEVLDELPDPPSYSAVRAMLRVLEEKGHLRHRQKGPRYIYSPLVSREKAKRSAVTHLLQTFFDGSASQAVATLLDVSGSEISETELERLSVLIDETKKEGR